MKTLDEVIKELQYWDTCDEYPECFYDDEVNRDALNYLKEYKRVQNKIEKIALGNIEDTLDKLDNKPLTWDELKTMEGKPVWVEEIGMLSIWIIIRDVTENWLYSTDCNAYRHEEYGTIWQVYKKERNEDLRRSDKGI